MTTRDLILQEMEHTSDSILEEVLDFLRYLKQKHQKTKPIRVISREGESTVSLSDALGTGILGDNLSLQQPLSPVTQIQRELKQALVASGYETREQIVELVQEVKREMLDEEKMAD